MKVDTQTLHVQLDPKNPEFYNNPYPYYHELRAETPLFFWEEFGVWCFLNHADVEIILRDRRLGRQINHLASSEDLELPPEREDLKALYDVDRGSILSLEPPAHTRLRSLVQKAFMARQIERLRPRIAELSHELIDKMQEQASCDLLPSFATPIPVVVIAEMLGVPREMCDLLLKWSHDIVRTYQIGYTPEEEQEAVKSSKEFIDYLKELVKERRKNPQEDLITKLIEVQDAGEKLTEEELISNCILFLNAGHEATVNVIGNGVYALLKNPEQLKKLRDNPDLIGKAVEELLRYDTPLHYFERWVLDDVEISGRQFSFGDRVAVLLGAANRDPEVFPNPDILDISREKNPHVSLGAGIHFCLGAPLARLELQISLPILIDRLPDLKLMSDPKYTNNYHFHGLESLQVSW